MNDLLKFLFVESAEADSADDELKLAENLEALFEAADETEKGELEAKKTPLAKALGEFGISDSDLQLDPEGLCLVTDNRERYTDILTVLGTAEAMHKLAEMGWVVTKPGDDAMTNEPPNYRVRFLEIATVDTGDSDKADEKIKEIIKKAREFATAELDRDDRINPVDSEDGKMGKKDTGVGKPKDGEEPEGKLKGSDGKPKMSESESKPVKCPNCGKRHDYGTTWCPACGSDVSEDDEKGSREHEEPQSHIGEEPKKAIEEGDVDKLLEMTTTASMGTAMGQPHVGLATKGVGGKFGGKFKMPGQWKVRQPVVKEQVKKHPVSEEIGDEEALGFLDEPGPGMEESNEPEEGDIITEDHRTFYQDGKLWLNIDRDQDWKETVRQVNAKMESEGWFPNIWFLSDHGNAHLISDQFGPQPEDIAAADQTNKLVDPPLR